MRITSFKVIAVLITGSLTMASCVSKKILTRYRQPAAGLLLQMKKAAPPVYIFIRQDTAYFEQISKGKGIRFQGADTLIRNAGCGCFKGRNLSLYLEGDLMKAKFHASATPNRALGFAVADWKQIRNWCSAKNNVTWNLYNEVVTRRSAELRTANRQYYSSLAKEWDKLLQLTVKLNRDEFDAALTNFKLKYSIP